MKAKDRKVLVAKELERLQVEVTVDEELAILVAENTRASNPRQITSVLRCITLIAGGTSMSTSCKYTGITLSRLNGWRTKEWYGRAVELIKQRLDEQLDGQFTHAINKGTKKLHERLDIGDPVVDRDGKISYKPVSARDAAIITSIFFDKRNLLRNKPTTIHSTQSSEELLVVLQDKFKEIAADAEYIEVIDDDNTQESQRIQSQECITYTPSKPEVSSELQLNIQTEEEYKERKGEVNAQQQTTYSDEAEPESTGCSKEGPTEQRFVFKDS